MYTEEIIIKKKFEFDQKYLKIAVYVLAVILISILFEKILSNSALISVQATNLFQTTKKLVAPFLYGLSIAYLFNPIVRTVEKSIFFNIKPLQKKKNLCRNLSILLTYILVIGCFTWLLAVFIPSIITSITNLFYSLPDAEDLASLESDFNNFLIENNLQLSSSVWKDLEVAFEPLINITKEIPLMIQRMLQTLLSSTLTAASTAINLILGLVISFYVLSGKERFAKEIKKIIYAFFDEKNSIRFFYNLKRVNMQFESFIIGKTLDSFIIGLLCFFGMSLIGVDFILIISVIIGITNMIPYFGPFIGAIPSIFIVLLTQPSKAIWVALFILALQQFDGIILGPKILGNSTGMNPLWIIFSIIIGGALAGPLGMFIGVPICASIKMFFNESVEKRYNKKFYFDLPEGQTSTKEDDPK